MKKTVALLLSFLLVIGLFVSCAQEPKKPVASEKTVDMVSINTAQYFLVFSKHVARLASGEDPQEIEDELKDRLARASGQVQAKAKYLSVSFARNDQSASATFYITRSSETGEVSGYYLFSGKVKENGELFDITVMSSFTFDDENYTITCFNVTVDDVSYDVNAFNEALKEGIPVFG